VNAYPHIERRDSGPAYLDRSDARPVLPIHRQMAEERYTKDVELIADWLCVASDDREPSEYWGPISTSELAQQAFSGTLNEEQCKAALTELRKRYLEDNESRIAFDAARTA
jgi:RNase P/RNase MRP subunit p30